MTDRENGAARAEEPSERRRGASLLWAGGALAAAVLVLAVNGTLSSWTTAIIDNNNNNVAVTGAVALVETGPNGTTTCDTASDTDNQVTCATINKYGGTTVALNPDGTNSRTVSVNLKNTGTVSGGLVLTTDACLSTAAAGSTGADPVGHPVCDKVLVGVTCSAPATMNTTATPVALSLFSGGTVGTLAAGTDTNCVFTLTLPTATSSAYASQVAAQVLHWTLTAS